MCLAMPGKIVTKAPDGRATVDMHGNRFDIQTVLTPEAGVGDWVLVHAGFAIATVSEADARETWALLRDAAAE